MLSLATPRRGLGLVMIGTLVAAAAVVVPHGVASAGHPCRTKVTTFNFESKKRFAGQSLLRKYTAHVNYPGKPAGDWHNQTARAIYAIYPANVSPVLMNPQIGQKMTTGAQVKAQEPQALAAINGDLYSTPTIAGKAFDIPRGPMVKDGHILRADHEMERVVGVDSTGQPFGGTMGVAGTVTAGTNPSVNIAAVNWEKLQNNGVTIYTDTWSSLASAPRPAGVVEWVLNSNNKIRKVRSSTQNTSELGSKVGDGTKVIAFPSKYALVGSAGVVGQKVKVKERQRTDTGVTLDQVVGRNLPLVTDGVSAPLGCVGYADPGQPSARPRTVIGWTKSGQWRSLTIPGSVFTGVGLRNGGFGLANVAALARKLGMYNAFELDGGGSTTLYTRSSSGAWSRRDLWGVTGGNYERPICDALAFVEH